MDSHSRSFAEALGIRIPQPYPLTFPRNLDFIPIHSLQAQIDPRQELFAFAGNVSIKMGEEKKRTMQDKDHLLTISQSPSNRLHTAVKYGHMRNDKTTTQEDLWEDVQDVMGIDTKASSVPELSIRMRGLKNNIPSKFTDHPDLQGLDYICQIQGSRGNRTRSYKSRFGLHQLTNPSSLIRNELTERGLWSNTLGRRMKSILRTESIIATAENKIERKGWEELFKMPMGVIEGLKRHKFPPLSSQLNTAIAQSKWHQDTGIPSALTGRIDSMKMQAVVYLLSKRRKIIVI